MKIKNILLTAFAIVGLMMLAAPATQAQCDGEGNNFIDLNGDGINDNAPDHDGDGIPNGHDADWIKNAQDGTGLQKGKLGESGMAQQGNMTKSQMFNRLQLATGNMFQKKLGALGGGSGTGTGVCDGTGGGSGTGVCDGTGPKGGQHGGGK